MERDQTPWVAATTKGGRRRARHAAAGRVAPSRGFLIYSTSQSPTHQLLASLVYSGSVAGRRALPPS